MFWSVLSAATLAAADSSAEVSPIWKWANFAILAVGLGYLMAKHLPGVFSFAHHGNPEGHLRIAADEEDAERRSAEMDARLNALGADIEKFRTQSAAEMQQEGDRISRETAAQIKKIEQQAAVELESVGKTARRQLKEYAAELAMGLAEERLRTTDRRRHGVGPGRRFCARPGTSGVPEDGVE